MINSYFLFTQPWCGAKVVGGGHRWYYCLPQAEGSGVFLKLIDWTKHQENEDMMEQEGGNKNNAGDGEL